MNSTNISGAQSVTSRRTLRRNVLTDTATMPAANHAKTRSCEVGTPTVTTIAAEATIHAIGAAMRAVLRRFTGAH